MDGHRRLPHEYPEDRSLFLTWHLQGAVKPGQFSPPGELSSGEAFAWMDRHLDSTRTGPFYLKRPEIAKIVVDSIHYCVGMGHYELHAYVVMSNHVHLLVTPRTDPSTFMRSLKGFTAREINKIFRTHRHESVAEGILRSLGAYRGRIRSNPAIHRKQSGEGGPGNEPRRFSVVERLHRHECRCGALKACATKGATSSVPPRYLPRSAAPCPTRRVRG
jgi:Transposase IS200 like